jgi:iron-sulfur cluster assembly protein|tara:strand:+ start:118 stop:450 length:333 start_codon:yes stop_codon:yes gene_type:complete
MSRNLINIGKNAISHMKNIAKDSPHSSVLIGVKGGGCNGLKYFIEPLQDKPEAIDEHLKTDDLDIIICGKSIIHLIGTEINWTKGYMGEGFEFINPNASSSCGCGETFSV